MRKPRNYIEARDRIANRIPFHVSSITADYRTYGTGYLDNEWRERYYAENPEYVVLSYSTPIAWYSADHGWTLVTQRFSQTTGRHQSHVRIAVS